MAKAGAVSGVTPVQPAGASGGSARNAGSTGDVGATAPAPSPASTPETAGRAAATDAAEPAVALAATLAGLKVGQELRGQLRFPPTARLHAWFMTPDGGFLVDPTPDLPPDSDLTVVLTRADRAIAGLLVAAGGEALDPPRPVRLALVSLPARLMPPPVDAEATPAPPGPVRSAQTQPLPAAAPAPDDVLLHSLLPGEPLPLRGRRTIAGAPDARLPARSAPQAAPPLLARSGLAPATVEPPSRTDAAVSGGAGMAAPAPPPASGSRSAPLPPALPTDGEAATALAALFDAPVLNLRVEARGKPQATIAVSMLAVAEKGEATPLTHPAPDSPLARLAANGRLVTAIVLPPEEPASAPTAAAAAAAPVRPEPASAAPAIAVPGAPAQSRPASEAQSHPERAAGLPPAMPQGSDAPPSATPGATPSSKASPLAAATMTPNQIVDVQKTMGEAVRRPESQPLPDPAATGTDQRQPMRLAAKGAVLEIDLPARLPPPAPGTQLVLLVTRGREALPAAAPPPPPPPERAPASPPPAENTSRPQAPVRPDAVPEIRAAMPTRQDGQAPAGGNTVRPIASDAPKAAQSAPAASAIAPPRSARPARPAESPASGATGIATPPPATAQPVPGTPFWISGMDAPIGLARPAAPLDPGEALLLAVMEALGRKGFAVMSQADAPKAQASPGEAFAEADAAALPPAQLLQPRATEARAATGAERGAIETTPDAFPLGMTLQMPHGPVPLTLLVWQPARRDEDNDSGSGQEDAGREVCFAVEVEFETLGLLRLRGAVTPRYLHLGVETEQPLGMALQCSATQDFTAAIEAGGMTGTLVFRHRQAR